MSDYLKKDDIVQWIDGSLEQCGSRYTTDMINMMEMFRTVINDCIPFADVQPVVHGKWVDVSFQTYISGLPFASTYECDQCKALLRIDSLPHFCPNCGARMDGGE